MLKLLAAPFTPTPTATDTGPRPLIGDPPSVGLAAPSDRPACSRDRESFQLLWIDDELDPGDPLVQLLKLEGFQVRVARTGAEGLAIARASCHDAIILDLRLPDMFGLTVLTRLRLERVLTPVLVITGYYLEPEIEDQAKCAGATALRHKPVMDPEDFTAALRQIINRGTTPPLEHHTNHIRFGLVAASPAMRAVIQWVERVAPTKATVLLTGETGTGKEVVATAIHHVSRRPGPFVPVNCAAIPESLIETELFGHRRGAFTGAQSDREGLAGAAHGGTLFLDEIGDLPVGMQGRLLRFLENGEVRRLGDQRARRVDVRVIAATNLPLRQETAIGQFREDLYYRLAVAERHIPPLRERPEDIEALIALWFSKPKIAQNLRQITPAALDRLRRHSWPGNIRELRNVTDRLAWTAERSVVTEEDVANALPDATPSNPSHDSLPEDVRRAMKTLEQHRWNHTAAARALGISRTTLWRMIQRHGPTN